MVLLLSTSPDPGLIDSPMALILASLTVTNLLLYRMQAVSLFLKNPWGRMQNCDGEHDAQAMSY